MPSQITNYRVFLASPGDLLDDRIVVDEAINELNHTFSPSLGIHLELVRWETHSAPGVSKESVQKIINKDIGDYDLFIGLLWKRFGTPTDEYNSGTEEEFFNAYQKFKEKPESIKILFYFKNSPFTLDDIDPDQLKKVKEFKLDIAQNKNVLHGEYNDLLQLGSYLRMHIPKRIRELHANHDKRLERTENEDEVKKLSVFAEEEYGIIDYQEIFDESIANSNQALNRITEAINWVSNQFQSKTTELNALIANKTKPPGRNDIRQILARVAKVMDNFGARVETESPIYFDNFQNAINSIQGILNIYRNDFGNYDMNEIIETRDSLNDLISAMEENIPTMEGFTHSFDKFPRISKELNKSKSNTGLIMGSLLDNLYISLSIAKDLRDSFDDFISDF
ncbi:DUF4062 domain-containing protein [Flagellimonas baculiformis]|uniref:DUF4062 domain-containing protein n=1 Tax=Flagellimonas baculiformis TaxID=3067310 RepID=UPI00296E7D27|nr:DUF4062 domain-containing protein [Muricauda sp. D6]